MSVVLLVGLASATHAQSLSWKDSGFLWRKALENNFRRNAVAHLNYSVFLARAGDERGAEFRIQAGAEKRTGVPPRWGEQLAVLLMSQHRYQPVVPMVERLIQITPATMSLHRILCHRLRQSWENREKAGKVRVRQEAIRGRIFLAQGLAFVERQEWAAAREQLSQAWSSQDALELMTRRRVAPLLPVAQWGARAQAAMSYQGTEVTAEQVAVAGLVLGLQGRWREAASAFGNGVRLGPNDRDTRWREALCEFRAGETERGTHAYREILSQGAETQEMARAWAAAQMGASEP